MNEFDVRRKDIKEQILVVIANFQNPCNLNQVMPLVNLLKTLEAPRNNLNHADLNYNSIKSENTKISDLVNLVHIENAYISAINKAMNKSMKGKETLEYMNKLRYEMAATMSKKRLLIIILKHYLYENNNFADFQLDLNVRQLIKITCKCCCKNDDNDIDQFCVCPRSDKECKVATSVTGVLNLNVLGFVGHYDSNDLNNIYSGLTKPCSNRSRVDDKCVCSGVYAGREFLSESKRKRMVVFIIDKVVVASSKWSKKGVDGLTNEKIGLQNAKVMEIQVWECVDERKNKVCIIARVTLEVGLLRRVAERRIMTVSMEPAGTLSFEACLEEAASAVVSKTCKKLRRRFSIRRRIEGYQMARAVDMKVDIATWVHMFTTDINKLTEPSLPPLPITNGADLSASLIKGNTKKVFITPRRPGPQKEDCLNMSPAHFSPHLHKINPRTVCEFFRANNNTYFHSTKPAISPKYSDRIKHEFSRTVPINDTNSEQLNLTADPMASPLQPYLRVVNMITSTPISAGNKPSKAMETTSVLYDSYQIVKGNKTRSNLELSVMSEAVAKENEGNMRGYSDDEDTKEMIECEDQHSKEELNILLKPTIFTAKKEFFNIEPMACSPGLKKVVGFDIDVDPLDDSFIAQHNSTLLDMAEEDDDEEPVDHNKVPFGVSSYVAFISCRCQLNLEDFDLLSVLGQGHFGKVLLARYRWAPHRHRLCALKVVDKKRARSSVLELESLNSEKLILARCTALNYPFITGLIGCFQTDNHLFFAIEYACGGDLMGHVHNNQFSEKDTHFYGACVVLALGFLHSKDVMYRDMKLDNLLMDAHGYVKLTDFGLSKMDMAYDTTTTTFCGTPEFLAPEIINEMKYTRVADWWSFGVLLYELILGESPFPGDDDAEIYQCILNPDITVKLDSLSPEAISLIMRLLIHNPNKRLGHGPNGTDAVKNHLFFKDVNWSAMEARTVPPPFVPALDSATDTKYFEEDFTCLPISIDYVHNDDSNVYDDEIVTAEDISEDLFSNFDTGVNWDKFV